MESQEPKDRVLQAISWLIAQGAVSSQGELANLMGYSRSSVNLIVNGKVSVTQRFAETLSLVTGGRLSADWIMTGKGEMLGGGADDTITLTFVRQKKSELNDAIAENLTHFTRETGLPVEEIGCEAILNGEHMLDRYDVDTTVVLDDPVYNVTKGVQAKGAAKEMLDKAAKNVPGPQYLEAVDMEEAVISALLLKPEALDKVRFLTPAMFTEDRNLVLFTGIIEADRQGEKLSILSLANVLEEAHLLERAGGIQYITDLSHRVMSADHVEAYARIVYDCAVRRDPKMFDAGKYSRGVAPFVGQWESEIAYTQFEVHKGYFENPFLCSIRHHMPYGVIYNAEEGEIAFFDRDYRLMPVVSDSNPTQDYSQLNPVISETYRTMELAGRGVATPYSLRFDGSGCDEIREMVTKRGSGMIQESAGIGGFEGERWYLYEDANEPYSGEPEVQARNLYGYLSALFHICSHITDQKMPNFVLHYMWMTEKIYN